MAILTASEWDQFLGHHPEAHLLQTSAWGRLKSDFNWKARWIRTGESGAQVLFYRLPLGFTFGYIPKGPVGKITADLLKELDRCCQRERAVFLKIEPDDWEDRATVYDRLLTGFRRRCAPVQPHQTILIDLSGSDDDLLARMKQKTRYNIRLAQKKGVVVHASTDLNAFNNMMQVTGQRDHFGVHNPDYYKSAYSLFSKSGDCILLQAEYEGQALAASMVFKQGRRAWYFYGDSSNEHRNLMPTYLIQWEGLRWAKNNGCAEYDLWGIPDVPEEELETQFENRGDGLWGVYRFKRGFGGRVMRSAGAWDKVYFSPIYQLYLRLVTGRYGETA